MTTRVVLQHRHLFVRDGLSGLLAKEADMEVVGAVDGIAAALQVALEHGADVLVLDGTSLDALSEADVRALRSTGPSTRFVVIDNGDRVSDGVLPEAYRH